MTRTEKDIPEEDVDDDAVEDRSPNVSSRDGPEVMDAADVRGFGQGGEV